MSLFPDPMKVVHTARAAVSSAAKLKVKKAVKQSARAVNEVTRANVVQALFPAQAIPKVIISGAISGGKRGALESAQSVLKNPVLKAGYVAVGIAFPPFAPLSAGTIASMEAASRLLDGVEAKDPKVVAQASLQLAKTLENARNGDPGAARAQQMIGELEKTRDIFDDFQKGAPAAKQAIDEIRARAKRGDKRAQVGAHMLEFVATRAGLKGKAPLKAAIAGAKNSPSITSLVAAAIRSPSGVRIGDFSVLSTGRILHKGKPVRK
jgi:hypothetical protein